MPPLSGLQKARRKLILKWRRFLGVCVDCGKDAYGDSKCYVCRKRMTDRQRRVREVLKIKKLCHECGSADVIKGKTKCSHCFNLKAKRNYKSYYKREELEIGLFVEYIDISILFDRDNGECQLCGRKVNINLKFPHPKCATRDHIIPLSKGGETSYKNMQLSHWDCNRSKGNRPVQGGEQMRLFG